MRAIDRGNPQKLYLQLIAILREKLEHGEWPVDGQIPTEDELCRTYEVSKATVRMAVAELARQGYLKRQQGRGTFVCRRAAPGGLSMLTSFRELMLEAGLRYTTRLLERGTTTLTDDLCLKLQVPDTRTLLYVRRVRSVAGEPVLLQESWLPGTLCPRLLEEDLEQGSLLEILEERCGVKIVRVRDWIGVEPAAEDEAAVLGLDPGTPCLVVEEFSYDHDGQVMYTRTLKNPGRFRLVFEFERKP